MSFSALEQFPVINSIAMFVLFVGTPLVPFFCGVYMVSKVNHWRGGRVKVFFCNCACMLNQYAPIIAFGTIFWACLICIVQVSYIYHKLNTGNDFNYYLKVDTSSNYDVASIINSAVSFNSMNVFMVEHNNQGYIRRLSETDSLQLVYHTHDWANTLTEENLRNVCLTEKNVLADVTCIGSANYKSLVPLVFNTTNCNLLPAFQPFNESLAFFAQAQYSNYVSDTIEADDPRSDVVVSYFLFGDCLDVSYSSFEASMDAAAVGGVHATFVTDHYVKKEFMSNEADLQYWTVGSLVLCIAFMVLGVRGLVLALTTLFCIAVALINAVAILPFWHFQTYSTFNALAVFVLLGVGANSVLLYGAAWRRCITPGTHATVAQIIQSYTAVSQSILFTTCVAIVALFSFLASPVIVIQQLGAVMGISIIVFYVTFHYILIPMWIFTSWFPLPLRWHRFWYKRRLQYCGCVFKEPEPEPEPMTRTVAELADENGSDTDSVAASVIPIENVRYDNWVNPNAAAATAATAGVEPATTEPVAAVEENDHRASHFNMLSFLFTKSSKERGPVATTEPDDAPQQTPAPAAAAAAAAAAPASNGPGIVTAQSVMVNINSTGSRASVHGDAAAAAEEEAPAPAPVAAEPEVAELTLDTSFCRGKRPLKFLGLFVLLVTIGALIVVFVFVQAKIQFYFGVPQMFEKGSNMYDALIVADNYKNSLFNLDSSAVDSFVSFTSDAPSLMPTLAPNGVTPAPSRTPTAAPSRSMRPTSTNAPTVYVAPGKHVDYSVEGCYGIHSSKNGVDGNNVITFNQKDFTNYMNGQYSSSRVITNSGLMNDLNSLCSYVDANRDDLSIHPEWVRKRDCIYDQLITASNSSYWLQPGANDFTMRSLLVYWGYNDYAAGNMLGLVNNGTTHVPVPLWVCANFSLRSYGLSSLNDNGHTAVGVNSKWQSVFNSHASSSADFWNVPVIVGSDSFSYSILAQDVIASVKVAALVVILGFIGLLWLFTISDFGITLLGSFAIFTIMCVSICLHVYIVTPVFDLLDVVVVIAIVAILCVFPIQLMIEYIFARFDQDERPGQALALDKHLSPALASTNRYVRWVLIGPCILSVLIGIPLLFAKFALLRKFGEYVIIVALVSIIYTLVFLPYLIALGCRTKWCEKLCYDEEDFHYDNRSEGTVEEVGGAVRREIVEVDDHEEGYADHDEAERERELIRIVTQQSLAEANGERLQGVGRDRPPSVTREPSMRRDGSYAPSVNSRYSDREDERSISAEEQALIRRAQQASMYEMPPRPPPREHSLHALPSHEELMRRAAVRQQSQANIRPPLYQQQSQQYYPPERQYAPPPPPLPPQPEYRQEYRQPSPQEYRPAPPPPTFYSNAGPPPPPILDQFGYMPQQQPAPRYGGGGGDRYGGYQPAPPPPPPRDYYDQRGYGGGSGRPEMNRGASARYSNREEASSRFSDYDDDRTSVYSGRSGRSGR